ncbi:immunoglobulin superfamily member 1 isoform X5 [Macaca thibetana thibetana]|uniref:immunoglobulin superfamily member 1 isoform X5 n=1 Tax=Macaca thibetana thibetana TaxID=257877 RepID=UPI0021BC6233|nr:immunoglobulin superfamily member 1 isoform X5 [Macaca thibetana thibetana]
MRNLRLKFAASGGAHWRISNIGAGLQVPYHHLLRRKILQDSEHTASTRGPMTLDRPGEGATMLKTFTVLLFCIRMSLGMTSIVMDPQPELWIESNYPQAPWENITLWCRSPSRISSKFLLLKDKTQMTWIRPSHKTFQVSFLIGALTESNAGLYRCCYWKEPGWSKPSKVLELEAPGQLPKPIFWIQAETPPLPGCNVNILCHGWLQDLVFMLFKEGYAEPVDYQVPTGTMAIFSIDNLTPEDEGVYICRTHIQMLPTLWSEPSNPLKLVVAGLYPKPTLTAHPGPIMAPGESLNLRCQGPIYGMTFALMRVEDLEKSFYHKKTIKNEAYFFFRSLKIQDTGHYLCFYYDISYRGSLLSDVLKIWVTDKPPKPSLSAWPSTVFKLGKAITLRCRVSHPVLEFSLEWEEREAFQKFSVDGDFIISNVDGKGTGTYSCSYRVETHPNIWSHRSEPLKLMGPAGYLTWNYVLNEAVRLSLIVQLVALLLVVLWIRWKCRRLRIREAWLLGTAQGVTMLFIVTALLSCGLCNGVLIEETEIVMPTPKPELWAETNFPLAPWKNLTLWCRSPSGSTKEFVLLKDGTGWIATRPASEQVRAAFPLGALTQSHTGSYHCHSWEEMAVSEPSEALELLGTDILPKPVISASLPIRGQELQLRCKGWLAGMGFALYKEGQQEPVQQLGAVGREAVFTIQRMEDKDEGNYSCRTHTEQRPFKWSEPSEPLELVIKEMYPKPFFKTWASPVVTPGARVTFNCSTPHQHMSFILYKDGSEIASSDRSWASPGASAAHFLIISVGIGDGGNYSCRYYDFSIWSEPSDPVELVVTEFYPKPTLLAQPGPVVFPGKSVTLRCQGTFQGMRFALLQEGAQVPLQFQSVSGNSADFLLHTVGAEDSGNYSCIYYETTMSNRGSYLSIPLMIWVTDTFPKPWLFAEPSSVVPMGQNVTLWCRGPVHGVGYILHKEEEATSMQLWGSTSNDGAFPITNISGASMGRYSCCYHPDWTSSIKIQPSNTLELIVTGLLPKPSLLAQPGPMVSPGENMTLQCQGELPDSTFVLLKEGTQEPLEQQRPSGYRADFWMPAVRGEDSGIYSCVYYLDSAPFAASNHSDSLEIWVTDKPPKPSLSAWPGTMFKLGKDIILQCRGPLPGVEFVLEHDGEEAPQQFSEDGDFVINNVEGKGIGNYSCSYRLQAYPDIWSEPSDSLELVGAAGPVAQECTVGNIVRSSLIVVVVVALGVVLAIEWKKWPRLRTRGSETDGRDQTIALEECNQEGEPGTPANSPSSTSRRISVELPVPI